MGMYLFNLWLAIVWRMGTPFWVSHLDSRAMATGSTTVANPVIPVMSRGEIAT